MVKNVGSPVDASQVGRRFPASHSRREIQQRMPKEVLTNIQKILSKQSYCNYSLSITVKNKSMQEYTTVLS